MFGLSDEHFFLLKGLIGLGVVIGIVVHMNISWGQFDRDEQGIRTGIGQRMRYTSWFLFVVLITGASAEQIQEAAEISTRNIAALFVIAFAALTVVVSIIEAYRKEQRRH